LDFISIINEFSLLSNDISPRNNSQTRATRRNNETPTAGTRATSAPTRSPSRGAQRGGVLVIGNATRNRNDDIRIRFGLGREGRSGFLTFPIDDVMNTLFAAATVQHPIMTDNQLEEIPKATISQEDVDGQRAQCAVCFEDYAVNEQEVRKLPCTHLFHEKCIFPWLKNNATCPVCRARMPNAPENADEDISDIDDVVIGKIFKLFFFYILIILFLLL
jgi:hypothetical protein